MFGSKCSSCAKKVDRKFNYCPYCGNSFKEKNEAKNYGMLGRVDSSNEVKEELKLPFGMGKMVESLVKQLEKQLNENNVNTSNGTPKGFKIKISAGKPPQNQMSMTPAEERQEEIIVSEKEFERRLNLPKVEAISKVKRLGDKIIYEIDAPKVRGKDNVVVTELASGLEVKIYSKNKCYVKFIPLKVEVMEYYLKGEKLFLELRV